MAGRKFIFDPPDRFVAGAIGEPGRRSFYLQASKGRAVLSVALDKVHVAVLAERIGQLIAELGRRGVIEAPAAAAAPARPAGPAALDEPVVEAFRVGALTITYDEERRDLTVEARELGEERERAIAAPDDGENGGDLLRVRLSLTEARSFADDAMQVVAAGRPPCPLCGEPLDPQGHMCLRRNGYVM